MNPIVTYFKYGATKVWIPVTDITIMYLDPEAKFKSQPGKTTDAAAKGTESSGPRNFILPQGKYVVILVIKGTLHDIAASENADGITKTGYQLRTDFFKYLTVDQQAEASKPLRFRYPHWNGIDSHEEFEGAILKADIHDPAGKGGGLDEPSFDFTIEFRVGKTIGGF